jgi:hypothetical protein
VIIDSPMRTLALEQDCSPQDSPCWGSVPTGFEGILEMDLLMNVSQQIQRLSLPLHSKMIPHRAVNRPLVTVFAARRESFRCLNFRKLLMLPSK